MSVGKLLWLTSAVILISGCQAWQFRGIEKLPPTASLPATSEQGVVEVRYFDGITGSNVDSLLGQEKYPDNPNEIVELTSLQVPERRADNYGSLVRGFIQPPADGNYRFFVSGDDETQFWLSTSDNPEDATLEALVPGYTLPGDYRKYSSQTSAYKPLIGGNKYYFEILHKEGAGNDHFSVAWEGPGISQQIVDGTYLYSWALEVAPAELTTGEAYSLGYRVGFLDGAEALAFNPDLPMLDNDNDGIYDNWEVVHGLNPGDPNDGTSDPDGDLLAAADEFLIGTAENNPDTDGDGLPDGVEYAYGLNPLDAADANEDLDGDGYSNLEEYQAGTELNDAEDSPAVEEAEPSYVAGYTGQYFAGTTFNSHVFTRVDESVNFDWARTQPHPDLPDDQFSVRWNGIFTAPHSSGTNDYRFTLSTNDGVRLYANGALVIDDWSEHPTTTFTYDRSLAAGEQLNLTIEYFEGVGSAVAQYSATNRSTGESLSTAATITTPDIATLHSQDTDGDGVPDTWELRHGLSAWVPDADGVNNTQGITNLEAYQTGVDPYTLETVETDSDGEVAEPEPTEPEPTEPAPTEPAPEPSDDTVTLSWTAPSTRMDGSSISLSEIDYYIINYGQNADDLNLEQNVGGAMTSHTFDNLATGTWYFTIRVVDTNGLSSAPSSPVSAEIL